MVGSIDRLDFSARYYYPWDTGKKQKTKNAFVCAILQIKRIKKNHLEKIKRVGGNKAENQVDSSNAL